jgi:hypothetical protein
MPRVTITMEAGRFLDLVVKPFTSAIGAGAAYDVFRNTVIQSSPTDPIGVVPESRSFSCEIDLPQLPGGGTTPPLAGGALQPIKPGLVLDELAKAIRDAERVLAGENMTMMTADVEVDLTVAIGGVAGGEARLKLHIGPVPQG